MNRKTLYLRVSANRENKQKITIVKDRYARHMWFAYRKGELLEKAVTFEELRQKLGWK